MNLSPTDKLIVEIEGHVAKITLNNPPANTFTEESLRALPKILETLDAKKDIYALVITGNGEKFFSAGADLNLFADGDKGTAKTMAEVFGAAFEALSNWRGVSIAAINGYAMGGGLECALACDLRIAEEQALMALPEATVGLLPCAGGTQNLPWLVGEGWAKRMILCGERIDAATAKQIGLVESVAIRGESLAKAMDLASKVQKQSPSSVTACKKLIQNSRRAPAVSGLPMERDLFVKLFDTLDQKEGVNSFLEKRSPVWKNQ